MASKQITENKKGISKETMFKEIALQLSQALPALKESLGDKKFEKRIKKAAKLLGGGIRIRGTKKTPETKLTAVKIKKAKTKVSSSPKKTAKAAPAK